MIGDVMFVRSSSPVSWIIRYVTKSEWSHVAIVLSEHFLIESDVFKRTAVRRNKYHDYKVARLQITDKERLELISYLIDQSGRGYDYKRIFGILLYLVGLTRDRNLWDDVNRDICNELVVRGLTHLNSNNIPKDLLDSITPSDVANVLLRDESISKSSN